MGENIIKVSVIMPVYNAQEHLRESLDSVLNQTLRELEVICVDDGSTDASLAILREYEAKDSRVRVLTQQNQLAGVARNHGMEVASGEYYAFLDADDLYEPEGLEKLYALAKERELDVAKSCSYVLDARTKRRETTPYYTYAHVPETLRGKVCVLQDDPDALSCLPDAPWTGLYRAAFLQENQIRFNGLRCSNDHSFSLHCLCCAKRLMLTDVFLTQYRVHQANSLVANRSRHFHCQIQSYQITADIIHGAAIAEAEKKTLLKRELGVLYHWYYLVAEDKERAEENRRLMKAFAADYKDPLLSRNALRYAAFRQWGKALLRKLSA